MCVCLLALGCIDEELLDGIDNDGDGRADEDSRGAPEPGNAKYRSDQDGADNNRSGAPDEAAEKAFYDRYRPPSPPLPFSPISTRSAAHTASAGSIWSKIVTWA